MRLKTGRARSKAFSEPPTMKVRVAASAPLTPPETGASTMVSAASPAAPCTSRAVATSIVELSIKRVPGAAAASTCPAPR